MELGQVRRNRGDRVSQAGSLKASLDFQIHKVEPTKSNFYEKDVLLLSAHLMSLMTS